MGTTHLGHNPMKKNAFSEGENHKNFLVGASPPPQPPEKFSGGGGGGGWWVLGGGDYFGFRGPGVPQTLKLVGYMREMTVYIK